MGKKAYNNRITRHHNIPVKDEKEGFNVHHPDNITKIVQKSHDALNILFGANRPKEQFKKLLRMSKGTLEEDVVKQLVDIFSLSDEQFYKSKMFKGGKKRKR